MTTEADMLASSRAVLIGVSAYEYADFPPIRAARNSLQSAEPHSMIHSWRVLCLPWLHPSVTRTSPAG